MTTSITFLKVTTPKVKLERICQIVTKHFLQKQHLLITTSDEVSALYLDGLLWKFSEESFIPHQISDRPIQIPVVITSTQKNLNQATVLLNLTTKTTPLLTEFEIVYELLDETDPSKHQLSKERLSTYEKAGYSISVI